jgi:hypothetical protein
MAFKSKRRVLSLEMGGAIIIKLLQKETTGQGNAWLRTEEKRVRKRMKSLDLTSILHNECATVEEEKEASRKNLKVPLLV